MKHAGFSHLHVHTQYSLLDGACLIRNLLTLVKDYRMPAIAITDHGNMFGAIDFYDQAMKSGVKPIIGCEAYIAPDSRFEKSTHGIQEASFHIVLLAKDEVGYKNLMRLVTAGYLEGFYYRPRIDKEVLAEHAEGLICLSACLKGEIPHLIEIDNIDQARNVCGQFIDIFGKGNFYLELQDNKMPQQYKINKELIKLSRESDIPLVATNDVHYLLKEDARAHEALLCIQTQTTLDDPNRMKMQTDEFYLKTPREMSEAFSDVPDAIKNTIEITEKCNLELDFNKAYLPHYKVPEGKTREGYLKELCEEGLKRRYGRIAGEINKRAEEELKVITKSGYVSYFLIAWDFVSYAKDQGIPVGPGRGSAAGSVVSYALGITDIDPLKYDLLFERFLNPERVSLPDIDIDFCYERRAEVIDYVTAKYSKENVAQIITFGTMMAKGVIRDVGRVMGMPYADVDKIAKLVPTDLNITIKHALEVEPELKSLYKNDSQITQLLDTSMALEGLTRHASTHAAGVVISENKLIEHIPLFKTGEQISTGYPMNSLEKIGLLKMDFLGLRTLTVVNETLKIIKRIKQKDINIADISLDDEGAFGLLKKAESIGVFQLESTGMRDLLRKLKPEKFEDLIAVLALFRPGPIGSGMVDDFIARKNNRIDIRYDHPSLEPILKDTYGIIVYQEQIMRIVSNIAGLSLARADSLRRAISKKTPEVMTAARKDFVEGCVKNSIDSRIADKLFNQIEYFAGYGFNRSHSAAYAMISYRTAYLKANYPIEFMTALLTSEKDNTDKLVVYIDEAGRMGIKIHPPDVNQCYAKFTIVPEGIRFGLAAVKNVGQGAVDSIIEARKKDGPFKSLYDFCERIDSRLVNRKVIESLIKCGAFDSFGFNRSQLMAILDQAMEVAGGIQKDRLRGQLSFFDTFEDQKAFKDTFQDIPNIPEWPENQLLSYEKQMLGFYITKHPLARYERLLKNYTTCGTMELMNFHDGDEIYLGGIVNKAKFTITKKTGEKMAIVKLEDLKGIVEVLVFPSTFQKVGGLIRDDAIVFVKGRISLREQEPKLIADDIIPLDDVKKRFTKSVNINIMSAGLEKNTLDTIKGILANYQGSIPVYLTITTPGERKVDIQASDDLRVKPDEKLISDLEGLLGEGSVTLRAS
ncbi:MAG: DNA polymerase III subunit alpha [Candidatus Omnitrophica bacterium]|nr:DNA polymerase III subunit alpha [Candidatus Omnitrophota bacterium]